jgi:hypothetical protein
MDINPLRDEQASNIAAYHNTMAQRPQGWPRADWAEKQGYRNLAFIVRDTSHNGKPTRHLLLENDGWQAALYNAAFTRCLESRDLREEATGFWLANLEEVDV